MSDTQYSGLSPTQRQQFDQNGYIMIENALDEFGLARVQAAYESVQRATETPWRDEVSNGTARPGYGNGPDAHTMFDPYKYDPIFLDIAANPRILPILQEVVGPDVQTMEIVAHCHHAGTQAHTAWHRDWPEWSHPRFVLKAKVFYFLDDQDEEMGCFSLVPGTHKRVERPPREEYINGTLEEMPGLTKITGRAGSAIVWNVLTWHTGLANTSQKDRRILIYGYMPFWVKKWVSSTPPREVIDWADTPLKRQLMGIHAVHGRNVWDRKDIEYLSTHADAAKVHKG
ncbi:phytanoyl-CoA dioxygenase family protein [Chloroflexi bacterium TSY]|nr:phytanoyl-CoA dioxygenase family protein [Chloroflexi bacterium TSY]